jgi:hypothetical protein
MGRDVRLPWEDSSEEGMVKVKLRTATSGCKFDWLCVTFVTLYVKRPLVSRRSVCVCSISCSEVHPTGVMRATNEKIYTGYSDVQKLTLLCLWTPHSPLGLCINISNRLGHYHAPPIENIDVSSCIVCGVVLSVKNFRADMSYCFPSCRWVRKEYMANGCSFQMHIVLEKAR